MSVRAGLSPTASDLAQGGELGLVKRGNQRVGLRRSNVDLAFSWWTLPFRILFRLS
jgi:hypothetical protein